MADKKITELTELSILQDEDLLAGVDTYNNVTSKITIGTLKDYVDTSYIAGDNITISDQNVISAVDTTYTAGTNVTINEANVISAPNVYTKTQTDNLLNGKEDNTNKTTTLSDSSTDVQYPSAKVVYDNLILKEDVSNKVTSIDENSTNTQYPSAKCVYDKQSALEEENEELKQEIDELYNLLPTIAATGTDITLDGTAEVKFKKLDLKGNTSQNGTPTPSSPQPIHVVSGDNVLSICGKNLLEIPNGTYTSAGNEITAVVENGVITLNGTATATRFVFSGLFFTLPKGTYSIKANPSTIGDSGGSIRLTTTDSAVSGASINFASTGFNTFTTTEELKVGWQIRTSSGVTYNNFVIKPQLEVGNQATTYEPYIGNTYPIYLPVENLFDKSVGYTYAYINSSGVEVSDAVNKANVLFNGYIEVQPNTNYIFSVSENVLKFVYVEYDANHTFIQRTEKVSTYQTEPLLTTSTTKYLRIVFVYASGQETTQTIIDRLNFMLEKGSKANHYTPYGTTPIELCGIDDYKDKPFKAVNGDETYDSLTDAQKAGLTYGNWYIYKIIGKVVLDGTNNSFEARASARTTGVYRFRTHDIGNKAASATSEIVPMYCNMLLAGSLDDTYLGVEKIASLNGVNKALLYINDISTYTLEQANTWLSTHNIIVYYVLATPTTTLITDSTLIEQLEALKSATSYEKQTNISQENNDLPFILDVEAIMSLKNVIDRLELLEE
jgi:hypothetical protein